MKFGLLSIYLLTASLFSNNASAQSQQEDSIFFQTAVDHTVAVYYDQLGDQSRLFNGSLYAGLDLTFQKGSPFFLSDKPSAGSVVYDSIYYPNLAIFYEDYRQTLVVVDHAFPLRLINEKVSAFNIADHHFEYVFSDLNRGIATAGFYEVLYNGRSRLLKHTSKKIREVLSSSEGLRRYMDEFNDYYIKGRGSYFNVSSKRELFKFVGVHKKEIQRFIRKNNLDFRDDKDNTLSKVAAYYDQIANN